MGLQGVQGASGGGGGGYNQCLNTNSNVIFNSVNINGVITTSTIIAGITSPGTTSIITYDYTLYSGSKHNIVVTDNGKIHAEDISLVVNGDSYVVESSINTTNGPLGTYSVTTSSNLVTLDFTTTATTSMTIASQSTFFPFIGGSAPPPTPPVSGYLAWYDTTSVNIGGGVWTDKSGNGFDGTISNGDGQVSLVSVGGSNVSGNIPAVWYQGYNSSNDFISLPIYNILNGYSDFTFFFVGRYDDGSYHGGRLITNWNGSPWILGFNGFGAGGPASMYSNNNPYGSNVNLGNEWLIGVGQPYFAEWNAYASTIVSGGGGRPGIDGSDVIYLGQPFTAGNSQYSMNAYFSEVIIYGRSLNSSEYGSVVTYLSNKYGITLGS
jgi:hypothetical protein